MKEIGRHLPNIGRILKTILIVAAIFFITVFTLVWFGIIAGVTFSAPFLTNFFPGKETLTIAMMINLLFVLGIPLISIIVGIVRLVWNRRMGSGWKTTLLILWLVNGVSFIAIGGTLAQEFATEDEIQQLLTLDNTSETLSLTYYQVDARQNSLHFFGDERIEMPSAPVRYAIKKSADQSWGLNQIVTSRGKTRVEARELALEIELPLKIIDGSIASPREIPFSSLSKWRNQKITLELYMPVGKHVRLGADVCHRKSGIPIDIRPENGIHLYQMSKYGKLICQDCADLDESASSINTAPSSVLEQVSDVQNFNTINLSGPMKVTIEYGESYSLKIMGNDHDLEEIEIEKDDDELTISLDEDQADMPVRVYITVSSLEELNLEATDNVLLRGFSLETIDITASGDFELKTNITVQELNLEASDGVEVEFTGEAELIQAELSDGSRLDTDRGTVHTISLDLEDASKVKLGENVRIIDESIDEHSSYRKVSND